VDGRILVACLENLVVAVGAESGVLEGGFETPAEIRAPPILAGGLLVLGMRDKSVIAYALGPAAAPVAEPAESAEPAAPATKPVEAPPPGR
jgi:hypothetical protein